MTEFALGVIVGIAVTPMIVLVVAAVVAWREPGSSGVADTRQGSDA